MGSIFGLPVFGNPPFVGKHSPGKDERSQQQSLMGLRQAFRPQDAPSKVGGLVSRVLPGSGG